VQLTISTLDAADLQTAAKKTATVRVMDTEAAVSSVRPGHFSDARSVHCAVVMFTVLVTVHSSARY